MGPWGPVGPGGPCGKRQRWWLPESPLKPLGMGAGGPAHPGPAHAGPAPARLQLRKAGGLGSSPERVRLGAARRPR